MLTSRCTTPLACALAQPRHEPLVGRPSAARFLVSGSLAATRQPNRTYRRSHDGTYPFPIRTPTACRRQPVRREVARAHRRDGDGYVPDGRRRPLEARHANQQAARPAERPNAAADGRSDDGQTGRIRISIARGRTQWCRNRVRRGHAVARCPRPPDRSGSTRPACAKCQVGRSAFHHRERDAFAAMARRRVRRHERDR